MLIWIIGLLKDYAMKEKYNLNRIGNQLKENRLLFELGEINKEGYEEKNKLLLEERQKAEEIIADLSEDMKIQEI